MTGDTSRGDRLEIRQEGITRLKVDAIINAVNLQPGSRGIQPISVDFSFNFKERP
jgi:hypothetical protein